MDPAKMTIDGLCSLNLLEQNNSMTDGINSSKALDMKQLKYNIILLCFILIPFASEGQALKIKWIDDAGREFAISAPTGDFSYSMLPGDKLEYERYGDFVGKIRQIGDVKIEYERYGDFKGKIIKVGYVKVEYENYGPNKGRLVKVGGLRIEYEEYGPLAGKIRKTTGQVIY